MRKIKLTAAALLALALSIGMAACSSGSSDDSDKKSGDASSMPEKKLEESQQDIVTRLAGEMEDKELANNIIRKIQENYEQNKYISVKFQI